MIPFMFLCPRQHDPRLGRHSCALSSLKWTIPPFSGFWAISWFTLNLEVKKSLPVVMLLPANVPNDVDHNSGQYPKRQIEPCVSDDIDSSLINR